MFSDSSVASMSEVTQPESAERAEYRRRARLWLEANADLRVGEAASNGNAGHFPRVDSSDEVAQLKRAQAWQAKLYDAGYGAITEPREFGGSGGKRWQQAVFNEEAAAFDVSIGFLFASIGLAAPALMAFGSDEQKHHFLPRVLRGDDVWCQLFSEPGAGSDLANLGTRAELDGDEFVVTGQKVWNSSAHLADWGLLLARTDPDAPKHKGISFFLLDMHSAGVEARPLKQMTGTAHFDEVFLDEVRVPRDRLLGELNAGWGAARFVLSNESAMIGGTRRGVSGARALADLARSRKVLARPDIRQDLARIHTREVLQRHLGVRLRQISKQGGTPPYDSSALKVLNSQLRIARGDLAAKILGAELQAPESEEVELWRDDLLNRFWVTIGGGTDDVHRNNIGERSLGLPSDVRVDKNVPWREQKG
jgi:alkylation response protein AidB-like acyl-CoA dehydrogenase